LTRCPEPDGTADVYDLTIEGEHEFFAGGILVHNCGEIGLWSRWAVAFDESIKFAVRKGKAQIICDGTPKVSRPARALIRRFLRGEEPGVIVRRLRTIDNVANLSQAFYDSVIGMAKGTRLERQELEGELLDDVENALWTRSTLERIQVPAPGTEGGIGHLFNAVIGVDPSDGNEDSDEQAYCVAGKGAPDDHHLYVARSWGGQMAPAAFARRVILEAVAWNARIVVEKNHGGAWLTTTFHQVMKDLDKAGKIPGGRMPRVETIHASQAKRTRAEPVSAMYERDLVRHCYEVERYQVADRDSGEMAWHVDRKGMVELEDQMATFTGAAGEKSPDRLDSLVWALTPFLNASFGPPGTAGVRKWAGSQEMENAGISDETKAHRRIREIAARGAPGLEDAPWGLDGTDGLDGFAPTDEQERPTRGNVRSWR
jgi:phage terminase large subunit-like protein